MNPLRILLQWDITQEIIKSQGCGALAKHVSISEHRVTCIDHITRIT